MADNQSGTEAEKSADYWHRLFPNSINKFGQQIVPESSRSSHHVSGKMATDGSIVREWGWACN